MFTKGNKVEDPLRPVIPKEPSPPSLLSADLRIVGDLISEGEIQVDGAVEGDIRTNMLVVSETALVKGSINADTVTVHGNVVGEIHARHVSLNKTAHVLGDIVHESLAIEQGAFLEGHCRRKEPGKKESEGGINLLIKGKSKPEPPPKKVTAEAATDA